MQSLLVTYTPVSKYEHTTRRIQTYSTLNFYQEGFTLSFSLIKAIRAWLFMKICFSKSSSISHQLPRFHHWITNIYTFAGRRADFWKPRRFLSIVKWHNGSQGYAVVMNRTEKIEDIEKIEVKEREEKPGLYAIDWWQPQQRQRGYPELNPHRPRGPRSMWEWLQTLKILTRTYLRQEAGRKGHQQLSFKKKKVRSLYNIQKITPYIKTRIISSLTNRIYQFYKLNPDEISRDLFGLSTFHSDIAFRPWGATIMGRVSSRENHSVAVDQVNNVFLWWRAEKARIREEMKEMKAVERINRKRKREGVKMQKEIERASRPKRTYREKLRAPSDQEDTQPIFGGSGSGSRE